MDSAPFDVTVGAASIVTVTGDVDANTASRFAAALDQPGVVVVDCAELTFLDSAGVGALVHAHRAASDKGGRVILVGANGSPLRVLQMTGLDELFGIAPNMR